jgi:hypothetical protein
MTEEHQGGLEQLANLATYHTVATATIFPVFALAYAYVMKHGRHISKPTNFSSALIRAPVSSYEGKKSKSNEGKKLGYTFWKVLLESSTRGVATSVHIHIGFSDT